MDSASQLNLFGEPHPRPTRVPTDAFARRSDPVTSVEAAKSVRLSNLETKVLAALRSCRDAGATLDELMELTGLEKVTVSPRLRPLARKGFVVETSGRRTGGCGRPQTIWVANEFQAAASAAS